MGAFRTMADVLRVKYVLDEGSIPEGDRALVLDWDDGWKQEVSNLYYAGKSLRAACPRPEQLFGFRIVWRESVTATRYSL